MIADRGNDRVLLVNQAKQVLWAYPGPNGGISMPFRFDDDVFFGPGYKTMTRPRFASAPATGRLCSV
jgi:hypothetical protein